MRVIAEILSPREIWIFALCMWVFIFVSYALYLHISKADIFISSRELRYLYKFQFVATYFPAMCFIDRIVDIASKYMENGRK